MTYLQAMGHDSIKYSLQGIPVAPTFFPTEEEFADPLTYINKIRPEGERWVFSSAASNLRC